MNDSASDRQPDLHSDSAEISTPDVQPWWQRPWALAILGAVLYWMALPPLGLSLLAFLAPVPWIVLIMRRRLDGKPAVDEQPAPVDRPRGFAPFRLAGYLFRLRFLPPAYRTLYLVGIGQWLALLYFLTLPHWTTCIAWLLAGIYFGAYLPTFVAVTRVGVHRLRVPVVIAAPVVWTGLELAREYVLTGCSIAALGHTQYQWIELIQVADLFGAYGVTFLVMLVAASVTVFGWKLAQMRTEGAGLGQIASAVGPIALAALAMIAAILYGQNRLAIELPAEPLGRVALIQGNIDSKLKHDESMINVIQDEYEGLTLKAVEKNEAIDVIIWPETMFRTPWISVVHDFSPETIDDPPNSVLYSLEGGLRMRRLLDEANAPIIFGIDRQLQRLDESYMKPGAGPPPPPRREDFRFFNSAALIRAGQEPPDLSARRMWITAGQVKFATEEERERFQQPTDGRQPLWNYVTYPDPVIEGWYDKQHPVMFGEYVPLADRFPWLLNLTPLPTNLTRGQKPATLTVGRLKFAPNICFESLLSRVIRRQVNELIAEGNEPNVLVNMTNDGWFYGSSELDLHLINGVFRAVECRKPFLAAANTGFSAYIDGNGRIQLRGKRRQCDILIADVKDDPRESPYLKRGDWASGFCLLVGIAFATVGVIDSVRRKRVPPAPGQCS